MLDTCSELVLASALLLADGSLDSVGKEPRVPSCAVSAAAAAAAPDANAAATTSAAYPPCNPPIISSMTTRILAARTNRDYIHQKP